ncbi:MAG: S1 RNA-binding domain-containing protein, partial [Alphaproteobacteria bacterium]|nr:S1 RNA-binding domain-containing protein [Alphaproteobacteria bacterium]
EKSSDGIKKGDLVTCTVVGIQDNGIDVQVADGAHGFIRKAELARERSEQRPDRFAVGEKVDAKVVSVDRATRKISLSIKAREVEEEKQAMAEYGSSDSGASLGEILGAAIRQARAKDTKADDEPKAKRAKKAKAADEGGEDADDGGAAEDKPAE